MYGQTVTALPVTGVGTAAVYAMSGPESVMYAALAMFTIIAAAKAVGRMLPPVRLAVKERIKENGS